MIDDLIESIGHAAGDLSRLPELIPASERLFDASEAEVSNLLDQLIGLTSGSSSEDLFHAINPVILALTNREQNIESTRSDYQWPEDRLDQILKLYRQTPAESPLRNALLFWLAPGVQPSRTKSGRFDAWIDLLSNDPPCHRSSIPLAFGPAMTDQITPDLESLESLLEKSLQHQQVAPAVFDLLNFYVRNKQVESHPAVKRADSLSVLLGQLAGQLGKIEEGNISGEVDPQKIGRQVSDSVALIVALCDTLALIGHEDSIGKLNQAASLKHRRVQTEAAAALARLGDPFGRQLLRELADEPVARLRVLNYAEELGIVEEISLENRGDIAIAESHLAIWLSDPEQMGIAPSRIKLIDHREMFWPGYENPVHCYLFKYEYGSEENPYTNIAICGPMTHAFSADLTHLEYEDIYALFAGWQTVHEEIYQMHPERAAETFKEQWQAANAMLNEAADWTDIEIKIAAMFFGKLALVATCVHQTDGRGTAIVDENQQLFFGEGSANAPIDFNLAFAIWQGRQLLATFNPPLP
ncbi:MAG: HEAT repeat domain-containing protein [Planctomycetota bacterium]